MLPQNIYLSVAAAKGNLVQNWLLC